MNTMVKVEESLRNHRITRCRRGYQPLLDLVALTASGAPCGRMLLNGVANAHQITAARLYGRLKTIQKKFSAHAREGERAFVEQADVYEFITYLAVPPADFAEEPLCK